MEGEIPVAIRVNIPISSLAGGFPEVVESRKAFIGRKTYRESRCVLIVAVPISKAVEGGERDGTRRKMRNTEYTNVHPKSIVISERFVCLLLTAGVLFLRLFRGSKLNNHPRAHWSLFAELHLKLKYENSEVWNFAICVLDYKWLY